MTFHDELLATVGPRARWIIYHNHVQSWNHFRNITEESLRKKSKVGPDTIAKVKEQLAKRGMRLARGAARDLPTWRRAGLRNGAR